MNTQAHTSGPWALGIETDDVSAQVINSQGAHVCTVAIDPLPDHARLIAAAPEMLEALRGAVGYAEMEGGFCEPPAWYIFAKNAIDRAEGRQQ